MRDDRGRVLSFAAPPRTIVSLVPSDTYSLFALGAGEMLVGRTRYCTEPSASVAGIREIGGTKNPDVDAILDLRPDLVLANQEENTKRDLERLAQAGIAVYVSFPKRMAQGLAHFGRLARVLGVAGDGEVKRRLREGYENLREAESARAITPPLRAFLPIWMDPLMTINGDTFISDALDLAGAQNVFADRQRRYPLAADQGRAAPLAPDRVGERDTRYPRITVEELVSKAPEIVILPDEPHAFTEADAETFRAMDLPAARTGRVVRTCGKDFSWYGALSLERLPNLCRLIRRCAGLLC